MIEIVCAKCGKPLGYIDGEYKLKCTGLYQGKKCGFVNIGDTRKSK